MKKQQMISIGLVAWGIFAIGYVINDQIQDFKLSYVQRASQQAYTQGQADAVTKLMTESAKCEPFSVFAGEDKVSLISVECLQKAQQEQGGGTPPVPQAPQE